MSPEKEQKIDSGAENAWGQVTEIWHEHHRLLYLPFSVFKLILLESVETNLSTANSATV